MTTPPFDLERELREFGDVLAWIGARGHNESGELRARADSHAAAIRTEYARLTEERDRWRHACALTALPGVGFHDIASVFTSAQCHAANQLIERVTALEAERDRLKNELYEISGIAENLVDVDIAQDQPAYAVSIMAQMLNEVRSTDAPASPPEGT